MAAAILDVARAFFDLRDTGRLVSCRDFVSLSATAAPEMGFGPSPFGKMSNAVDGASRGC